MSNYEQAATIIFHTSCRPPEVCLPCIPHRSHQILNFSVFSALQPSRSNSGGPAYPWLRGSAAQPTQSAPNGHTDPSRFPASSPSYATNNGGDTEDHPESKRMRTYQGGIPSRVAAPGAPHSFHPRTPQGSLYAPQPSSRQASIFQQHPWPWESSPNSYSQVKLVWACVSVLEPSLAFESRGFRGSVIGF